MSKVKVQPDEDVNPLLARDLRDRGYDAISASEANNLGVSDRDQLDYARAHGRLFLTHNRDDFLEIATEYAINQITYPGKSRDSLCPSGFLRATPSSNAGFSERGQRRRSTGCLHLDSVGVKAVKPISIKRSDTAMGR